MLDWSGEPNNFLSSIAAARQEAQDFFELARTWALAESG